MVGVAHGSVSRWRQAYEAGGEKALAAKPHHGPKPKLSDKQRRQLHRLLLAGPTSQGYANELWTLKRVADLIRRRWRVEYDPSGVWHLLRRMGWTCQKPERSARERDEEVVERWRQKDWPRIKKSP
jgi:transposase